MSEKLTAIDRLEEILRDREHEISTLKSQIRKQDEQDDEEAWFWTRHSASKEVEGLPVPRL